MPGRWRGSAGPTRSGGSRSPGSTPMAMRTPRTRRRPGTCGGCRSRCCSVTARPTSSRRAKGRLSSCATRRCSAGRCWTRRSRAGCRRRRSAHLGCGMLATPGGSAALRAWAEAVAAEVDGLYIAVDHDVLDAAEADWAVTMPEAGGLARIPPSSRFGPRGGASCCRYGATTVNFGLAAMLTGPSQWRLVWRRRRSASCSPRRTDRARTLSLVCSTSVLLDHGSRSAFELPP